MILYVRMAITVVVSLYTSRVILEALGFTDFGIYSVVGGIVVVFSSLTSALAGSSARYITLELAKSDSSRVRNVFSTAAILHIMLAIILVIVAEIAGVWFLNTELDIPPDRLYAANWVLQFSILAAAVSVTQVPYNSAMIAHEHMSIFAYVGMFSSFANLGIAFVILYEPFDRLIWYALLVLIVNVTSMMISRLYCLRHFQECHLEKSKDIPLYKEMLSYTGYSLWINIAWSAQNQGVSFVLNIFFGPVLNAAQSIGTRVYSLLEQLYGGFGTAVRPSIFRLYAHRDYVKLNDLVMRGAKLSFMLVALAVIPIAVNMKEVLTLWLKDFPSYSIQITTCLMVVDLFFVIGNTRLMLFQASNHIKTYSLVNGTILLLGLPAIYIVYKFGGQVVYGFIVLIITAIISDLASVVIIKRYLPGYSIRFFLMNVHLRCFSFAAVVTILTFFVKQHFESELLGLFVSTLLSVSLVGCYIWFDVLTACQRANILNKLAFKKNV